MMKNLHVETLERAKRDLNRDLFISRMSLY